MADAKISALTPMSAMDFADEFVVVDKSDTAQAATGSTRKVTVATLLNDPVFQIGFQGLGPPPGAGGAGQYYYDLSGMRTYRSDGIGWVIMSEPIQTSHTPTVSAGSGTITTVGTRTFAYHREDGWLDWEAFIGITTNGTGAGFIIFTLPIAAVAAGQSILGTGREILTNGNMLNVQAGTPASNAYVFFYNNTYPASSGCALVMGGRYRMTTRYS